MPASTQAMMTCQFGLPSSFHTHSPLRVGKGDDRLSTLANDRLGRQVVQRRIAVPSAAGAADQQHEHFAGELIPAHSLVCRQLEGLQSMPQAVLVTGFDRLIMVDVAVVVPQLSGFSAHAPAFFKVSCAAFNAFMASWLPPTSGWTVRTSARQAASTTASGAPGSRCSSLWLGYSFWIWSRHC